MAPTGRDGIVRIALRALAIAIAVAAAFDPAITTVRRGKPIVSVRALNTSTDSALALRVSQQLRRDAYVIPARFGAADVSILVGDGAVTTEDSVRTFIVRDDTRPRVTIEALRAPKVATINSIRRVDVTVHAAGARGRAVEVSLKTGEIVVDRVRLPIAGDDADSRVELAFVPTAPGAARLRVEASIVAADGALPLRPAGVTVADGLRASADALVEVVDRSYAVLVYDPRPSWMSTFVRRALERDPQFAITSRVVTARSISTSAGSAPERLDDLAAMERFDAIIVGAPEALNARDVSGLEAFMRRRGGSVVLLLDQRASGAYERLTGVRDWRYQNDGVPVTVGVVAAKSAELRGTELLWPSVLPEGAYPVATMSGTKLDAADRTRGARRSADTADAARSDATPALPTSVSAETRGQRPIIWSTSVGAGRLVVSGALDAWRFRDSASSHFDRGWQVLIADAASSAPPPIAATVSNQLVIPGETTNLSVVLRDAALKPLSAQAVRATISATLESGPRNSIEITPIQLLPDGPVGSLSATLRAPRRIGGARIIVTADGRRTEMPLIVDSIVPRASAPQSTFASAFAASRGGKVIPTSKLSTLSSELAQSLQAAPRRERWHPMRAWWWMLVFAGALSGEWWMRRRRGRS